MLDLLDDFLLGPLNLIDRIEGLVKQVHYRDSAVRFAIARVDKGGSHSLQQVEGILAQYEVPIFGRTHDGRNMYFLIKQRQAVWAEYLLLNAGVELRNPPVDPRNAGYPASHPPGWMPHPWSTNQARNAVKPQASEPDRASPLEPSKWRGWLDRLLEQI